MVIFLFACAASLSVKDHSKLPKSLLVGAQCLDRVMFCPKPFDFNDFSNYKHKNRSHLDRI